MKTTVILVRHGLTDWNSQARWQGQRDIPLNETGLRQGQAVAKRLAGQPIDALYTSDLQRAARTAAFIEDELGLTAINDPAWRERDFGAFEGLTMPEIASRFPREYQEMQRGIFAPPGGEDDLALHKRATGAFEQLVSRHPGQTVAVVSHGGTLSRIIAHILGLPAESHGRLSLRGNTGISIIEANDDRRTLVVLNDTAHLEPWAEHLQRSF